MTTLDVGEGDVLTPVPMDLVEGRDRERTLI